MLTAMCSVRIKACRSRTMRRRLPTCWASCGPLEVCKLSWPALGVDSPGSRQRGATEESTSLRTRVEELRIAESRASGAMSGLLRLWTNAHFVVDRG
jgi:hypothetical protein